MLTKELVEKHLKRFFICFTLLILIFQSMPVLPAIAEAEEQNLKTYLEANGGEFALNIVTNEGSVLGSGDQVFVGDRYTLQLGYKSPNGFPEGTYTYSLPKGTYLAPKSNVPFINSKTGEQFGEWSLSEDGVFTFIFNEKANLQQNVNGSISSTIQFVEGFEEIEFEGTQFVVITRDIPDLPGENASIYKMGYGETKVDDNGETFNYINWHIGLQGNSDEGKSLAGTVVREELQDGNQKIVCGRGSKYPSSMRYMSVEFYVPGTDTWYAYTARLNEDVTPIDEFGGYYCKGFEFTIPETFTCSHCNDPVHNFTTGHQEHTVKVGNNWRCILYVNSLIDDPEPAGEYSNKASWNNLEAIGSLKYGSGVNIGHIKKEGKLENGVFNWYIDAEIVGATNPTYFWFFTDENRLKNKNDGTIKYLPNDLPDTVEVTATYKGEEIKVPYYKNATGDEPFAWAYYKSRDDSSSCEFDVLRKCHCYEGNHEDCAVWNNETNRCDGSDIDDFNGYCRCWHEDENVTFHIKYSRRDSQELLDDYGGQGNRIKNTATIFRKDYDATSSKWKSTRQEGVDAYVGIPGMFGKDLASAPDHANGYTAAYIITLNEAYEDLSINNNQGVIITDKMSDHLYYREGSMKITKESQDGKEETLEKDIDYTIEAKNNHHDLEIKIVNPGPYLYTLRYKAAINTVGHIDPLPYYNDAEINFGGVNYTAKAESGTLVDYENVSKTYAVDITKVDSKNKNLLKGATFGLFTEDGGLVAKDISDENGKINFTTNISDGLIFTENEVYYVQEIEAPKNYRLDKTPYYFYYSDSKNDIIENKYPNIKRGEDNSVSFTITNQKGVAMLPDTGGNGVVVIILAATTMILLALFGYLYMLIKSIISKK